MLANDSHDSIESTHPDVSAPIVIDGSIITNKAAVAAPKTTAEEDRGTHSQRFTRTLWEATQAALALGLTAALIWAELSGIETRSLSNAVMMILALYFQRTIHTKLDEKFSNDRN